MKSSENINNIVKKTFKEKGTCSRTFAYLLNSEFGNNLENEERATDPLAGGIMRKGQQCGMLWGSALAIGAESYNQTKDVYKESVISILATKKMMDSFVKRTNSVNCKDITGCSMDNFFGMAKYMAKVMLQGLENSTCFNLAEDWCEDAIRSSKEGLSQNLDELPDQLINCASEVVRHMGGNEEQMAMVAGFAGGMGLSGNGCGALSAAIWMRSLEWVKNNPGKSAYNTKEAKVILKLFINETNGEMICSKICGSKFKNIQGHSDFIKGSGCANLMRVLSA